MKTECLNDSVKIGEKTYPCTVSLAMDLIGGKWKTVILYHLIDSPKRYGELRKDMPSVTEMTLSLQLKQLEKDGLIYRTVKGDKPPIRVDYGLTEFGKTCIPVLVSILGWGNQIAQENSNFMEAATDTGGLSAKKNSTPAIVKG